MNASRDSPARCPDCAVAYVGEFCHSCGQRRQQQVTLHGFLHDVRRRVFRLDAIFATTVWRMLRDPGQSFSRQPLWKCALRVSVVLALGYAVLGAIVGLERSVGIVGPLMPGT